MRLELTQANAHYPLKVARLPFRHYRFWDCKINYIWEIRKNIFDIFVKISRKMHLEVPGDGKKVLLHCCCAPCSGAVLECLVENGIRPGLFFSNSNIVPFEEYELRRGELIRYAARFGLEVIDDEYDHEAWLDFVLRPEIPGQAGNDAQNGGNDESNLAEAPERGERCLNCFKFRLMRAAKYAASHGYGVLTTTLASSRWKSLEQVDEAGRWACNGIEKAFGGTECRPEGDIACDVRGSTLPRPLGVQGDGLGSSKLVWWSQNWRKGGLQPRRAEIIKEQCFYNQNYCGCEFSQRHDKE